MKLKIFFLLVLTLLIVNSSLLITHATVRFVSKTGSSTPPYTSWQTAADSIQKCINYCVDGDTIYVANGVYKETLLLNKQLWLIGSSMDSTIINGTGLNGVLQAGTTVDVRANSTIENFHILGRNMTLSTVVWFYYSKSEIRNCKIEKSYTGVAFFEKSAKSENIITNNTRNGIFTGSTLNIDTFYIHNCSFNITEDNGTGVFNSGGGFHIITNNIILAEHPSTFDGIELFHERGAIIENNIISEFFISNYDGGYTIDTAIIHNNIFSYVPGDQFLRPGIQLSLGSKTSVRNNILFRNDVGISSFADTVKTDYNLFWGNTDKTGTNVLIGEHDFDADPMFVKDTIPVYGGSYDYHLQMYSPAIDAGDPNILDVGGTRSDVGAYGGSGGEKYTYIDLPPRPPVNLSAEIDTVSNIVILTWNRNSEADTAYYNIYRDSTINFTIDSTKLISSLADTVFLDVIPPGYRNVVYKVTAVDNQDNESLPSEEQLISIVGIEKEPVVINNYILYQNYPNPFNPSTKIGYKLKERGYIKLMVYDIKGELIQVLVNEVKEAGYYEAEFNAAVGNPSSHQPSTLSSGIYIYKVEIIGEGQIPRFSDMKKMILLK